MKVFVADDQSEVRSALRLILEHHSIEVIGEASHFQQLQDALIESCPDVLLFDWELPGNPYRGGHPSDPLKVLLDICPDMQVVVMSCLPESRQESAPLACCYVSKSEPPDIFVKAVTDLLHHSAV